MKFPRSGLNYLFSKSIRNKIIIPYAILTLVLAAFGTYVVTWFVADAFERRFVDQLIDAGRVVSNEVVNRERLRLQVGRNIAGTLGVPETLITKDWQALNNFIAPIMTTNADIDSIIVLDTQGREVLQFRRELYGTEIEAFIAQGTDFNDWQAVKQVLGDATGTTKAVEIAEDKQTQTHLFYTISPLRTTDNLVGALLIGTYVDEDIQLFQELAVADALVIFDSSANALESTNLTPVDEEQISTLFTPAQYQAVIFDENRTILDSFDASTGNIQYRLAYAPLVLQDQVYGAFAVARETNFMTATNRFTRNILALMFSVGVVVVLLVGVGVSQQIIKPILGLVDTTKAIAKGNLDQRTNVSSTDEVGVLAENFDIMTAELRKKTFQLEQEASKLTAILTSIADGVIVQDTSGRIIRKNPAADKIIEAIGKDLAEKKQDNEKPIDPLAILLEQLADMAFYEPRRLEIGQRVISALSASVATSEEALLGSVVVLRDITQEVIAEKLKDKFIQSVSHELKTPMFPLTGSISLIKMMLPMIAAQVPPKIHEKLVHNSNVADEQANDIKNVVMAMVDLSEIDGDSFSINPSPMNITEVVELVAGDWFSPMEEKGLEFDIEIPDEAVWVNGDEEKLRQVLRTLLKNARDYTHEGQIQMAVFQENGHANITIKDTGVGILKKDQPQLFTRFYRAIHDKKTFELSGIGLGLYLSRVIVERQDGEIWMESEPYEGSVFSFSLPAIPEPEPADDDWDDWDDDDWGEESVTFQDGGNIIM